MGLTFPPLDFLGQILTALISQNILEVAVSRFGLKGLTASTSVSWNTDSSPEPPGKKANSPEATIR